MSCNRPDRDEGTTLIEVLVVVLIIGILAGAVCPSLLQFRYRADYAAARSILRNLVPAIVQYRLENGDFPPDVSHNTAPRGLELVWTDADAMPLGSPGDYEYWRGSRCIVALSWFGLNQRRDTPVGSVSARGDDVMIAIAIWECEE